MDIVRAHNNFKPCEEILRCPICGSGTSFRNENSLVCIKGHCFNLSKHGYINFASGQSKSKYTKDLFVSRRYIFDAGFFEPMKRSIKSLVDKYSADLPPLVKIFDAGCGEGFFASEMLTDGNARRIVFGLDIFKEAVVLAAKRDHGVKWIVGDLSNIPLRTGSADILLNIFAPANYAEFSRVMSIGGIMIKVIPGRQYLAELREYAGGEAYSNEQVLRYFYKNMECVERKSLFYQMPLTKCDLENFIRMTPLLFNADKAAPVPENIERITIEADILVGRKPQS